MTMLHSDVEYIFYIIIGDHRQGNRRKEACCRKFLHYVIIIVNNTGIM